MNWEIQKIYGYKFDVTKFFYVEKYGNITKAAGLAAIWYR